MPKGRHRVLLLATTALGSSLIVGPALAQNLPTGGSVAAGGVAIAAPTPTQMNITQTTQSAVVNWQSFSVGQGYSVNIQQPNSTSALLNRVTGDTPSTIAGSITANGHVYLVNPNGIAITSTGVVNTGGFVASTLGISDSDFMSGKRSFAGNGASAGVTNAGAITVGRGGYAALIGGTVENSGSIVAPLGKVGLGSGEHATLDFSGDGFLQVAMPTTAGGSDALIRNSGTIRANGGSVIISVATAREAARNAVNISGVVQARTIGGRSGSIVIGGGLGGTVKITGEVTATANKTTGGAITVTGQHIVLDGATIDVTGRNGGGTINIGGGRQGQGALQHADTLSVDATTTIRADATVSGNGGDVVLWSDQLTMFAGTITARGGFLSGNGGSAEVSGKAKLNYTGLTDLSAANGKFGTLLLDPYNVTISNGTNNTGGSYAANANDSIINAATLMTALGLANVTVTTGAGGAQAGDITVAAPLTWSSPTILTLTAANAVTINAPITITGAGGLAVNAVAQSGITTSGLTFGNGASVSYAGGGTIGGQSFSLNGNNYTLVYTMAQLDAIDGRNALDGSALTVYGTGRTGNYVLANDIAAGGTTYTRAIIGDLPYRAGVTPPLNIDPADAFSGRLDGLGHIVTDLTIDASASARFLKYHVGLVGMLVDNGTVSNIGVVGGSIAGYSNVGTVVGNVSSPTAVVQNSYGTATVTSTGGGNSAGGLVGANNGLVQSSYATGAVTGGYYVGGLVGYNMADVKRGFATGKVTGTVNTGGLVGFNSGGLITSSYATGAVSGGDQVGGLAGTNSSGGVIQTSYSTGFVSGTTNVGGLIGSNYSSVVSTYWNIETSGKSSGMGSDNQSQSANVTARTTAQLQNGSLPSGFGASWGVGTGLYPYLLWQFPAGTTPQSVSGFAHLADNSPLVGARVTGAINGTVMPYGAVSTGANGYYYFVVPQGSIVGAGSGVFTAIAGNAIKGNAFAQGFSASVQNLELYENQIRIKTNAAALSDVASGLATAAGSLSSSDLVFTTPGGVLTSKANTSLILRASNDFTIDQNLVVWNTLEVFADNALTIAASGSLTSRYDVITLVAGTTFTNNSGADALTTPYGRWLIYSNDPANDTRGGLVYGFKQYGATYGVTSVAEPLSNGVLYSTTPGAVNVALTGVTNSYDGNVNAILAPSNFAVTGAIDGDVFSFSYGSAVFSDKNAATGLNVTATGVALAGVHDGAATVYGYTFTPPGTLNSVGTITPALVTVTAPSGSSLYGSSPANPGYTATGLQNGEGLDVLTGLSNTFGITSSSGPQGNPYNLAVVGTLTNPNYTIAARVGGVWTVITVPTDIVASTVNNSMAISPSNSSTDNSTDPTAMLTNGTSFTGSGPSTTPGSTVNGGELFYADKRFGE